MSRAKSFLFPIVLLLSNAHLAAEVLDVRGPAPDFAEIADAVVAAQDGDVIRIWPGTYDAFWIDDKSLTLVAATNSPPVWVDGTFRVKNLAPHRSVEISGIGATGIDGYALVVSDCRGAVRIREGVFVGASYVEVNPWYWPGHTAVLVTGSDDVEMTYCTARGGEPGSNGDVAGDGGSGMQMEASYVSLFSSTFEGTNGTVEDDPGASGLSGGDGIYALYGGRAYISGCTLIGGHGANADGEPDMWGYYGYGGWGGWGFRGPDTEAWFLDNVYQPGGAGVGGGGDGQSGEDTSPGTDLPGVSRILRASRLIDDTSTIAVNFTGSPGDLVSVRFTRNPGYQFGVVRGPLLLHVPAPPQILPWRILGTIDATGVFQTTIGVKDLPSLGHETLHVQGNLIGAENYYTSSSWTVVLDSAW